MPDHPTSESERAWEAHTCADPWFFDRTCLACQDRGRMCAHEMTKVAGTRLDAAVAWILEEVVGGGRIRANLPRDLQGELANALVDLPAYGWPDSTEALKYLHEEGHFDAVLLVAVAVLVARYGA